MSRSDQLMLIANVWPLAGHLGGWRDKRSFEKTAMDLDSYVEIAQLAERGKFHSLFLADGNAVRQMDKRTLFENVAPHDRPVGFEPTTLMAVLSQSTEHIGLFCTLTTTYNEPYQVARSLASLDHLSKGRAVWNVVTTSYPGDRLNFGDAPFPEREQRYRRGVEFVEVCKNLWDSWAEDAFPQDKATGKYLDADRVRKIDHHGEFFDVQGPLNVARMPQGYPVLFMAGQSEPGRDFAAKHAELVFANVRTKEQCLEIGADIRSRMERYDRDPHEVRIIPEAVANVAETKEEALELNRYLASLVSPALGIEYLSATLREDMSQYDLDGPLPDLTHEIEGIRSERDQLYRVAVEEGLTIRQTYMKAIAGTDDVPWTGTAEEVADQMQDWFESGACDGFMIQPPTAPLGLQNVVDLLVPELQRRGLFHEHYRGATLRENIGLPTPTNVHFD